MKCEYKNCKREAECYVKVMDKLKASCLLHAQGMKVQALNEGRKE